jgi:hypothetical protein
MNVIPDLLALVAVHRADAPGKILLDEVAEKSVELQLEPNCDASRTTERFPRCVRRSGAR